MIFLEYKHGMLVGINYLTFETNASKSHESFKSVLNNFQLQAQITLPKYSRRQLLHCIYQKTKQTCAIH